MELVQAHTITPAPESVQNYSGRGHVQVERINGRSVVTRLSATSPLKLLNPRTNSDCAWIFTSTYGGGLLGGDSIRMEVDVAAGARCLLSTQASTKIYRTTGKPSRQELFVSVDDGAIVVSAPDPIVCFAHSKYQQRQRFILSPESGLVMIDWFTSGRLAREERWAFDRFDSRTDVFIDDRCIFRDAVRLDPADGALDGPMRMGMVNCYATIVVAGKPVKQQAEELIRFVASQPAPGQTLLFSVSRISEGVVLRVAGRQTETVSHWIRERLGFVANLVGQDPWARKC